MPAVRLGPVLGLIAQPVLLLSLTETVGLGAAGWLAGIGYGAVTCLALHWGMRSSGAGELEPADRVTLVRATLVGCVAALVVESYTRPEPGTALVRVLVGFAIAALVLDAVDGQVARRTQTVTALGARFDMEVDASLILVLSGYVARPFGGWVLSIGLMRYVFVAATWALPWLREPVPPRYWRKVVAATQGIVLTAAAADLLPRMLTEAGLAVALALLAESFGRDVVWLWRHRSASTSRPAGERASRPA